MKINDLKEKQRAKLISYGNIDKEFRCKLIGLGLFRGCEFYIERRAPLGGPLQIIVDETSFSVRPSDIEPLTVEIINE